MSDSLSNVELWLRTLLIIAAISTVLSVAVVIAGTVYFLKAREYWRKVRRGPEVMRDANGRRLRERI